MSVAVEWVHFPDRRVDREVGRLFDRAFEKAREEAGRLADERRRAIAETQEAPLFPAEWGAPLAKYWIVPGPGGEQCASPIPPVDGKGLTVWRFAEFEVTATWDLWRIDFDAVAPRWGLSFHKNPPPVGEWEEAGPTDNYSTLWRRPLKGGAA